MQEDKKITSSSWEKRGGPSFVGVVVLFIGEWVASCLWGSKLALVPAWSKDTLMRDANHAICSESQRSIAVELQEYMCIHVNSWSRHRGQQALFRCILKWMMQSWELYSMEHILKSQRETLQLHGNITRLPFAKQGRTSVPIVKFIAGRAAACLWGSKFSSSSRAACLLGSRLSSSSRAACLLGSRLSSSSLYWSYSSSST